MRCGTGRVRRPPRSRGRAPRRGPELVGSRAADETVPTVVALEEVVPLAAHQPVVAGSGTVTAIGEEVVVAGPSVDDVAAALAVEPVRPGRAEEGVRVLASRRSGAGSGSARWCRPRRRSPSPASGPVPRSTRTGSGGLVGDDLVVLGRRAAGAGAGRARDRASRCRGHRSGSRRTAGCHRATLPGASSPPNSRSSPVPPTSTSVPSPPHSTSSPPSPSMESQPPRPAMTSGPFVPVSSSKPSVPTIVGSRPSHVTGAGAAEASDGRRASRRSRLQMTRNRAAGRRRHERAFPGWVHLLRRPRPDRRFAQPLGTTASAGGAALPSTAGASSPVTAA